MTMMMILMLDDGVSSHSRPIEIGISAHLLQYIFENLTINLCTLWCEAWGDKRALPTLHQVSNSAVTNASGSNF